MLSLKMSMERIINYLNFSKSTKGIFGKCFGEFSANGWVWDAAFSPSGKRICFVSHDATLSFVDWENENAQPVVSKLSILPLTKVLFLTETTVVASCFDYSPYIFTFNNSEVKLIGRADSEQQEKKETRVVNKFTQNDKKDTNTTQKVSTRHKNVIK
jgi:actin related protein 2/3 complex subunit 1A/1B